MDSEKHTFKEFKSDISTINIIQILVVLPNTITDFTNVFSTHLMYKNHLFRLDSKEHLSNQHSE